MKKLKYILVSLVAALSFTGCFDLEEETFDQLDTSKFYSDEQSLQSVIASIYAEAMVGYAEYYWYIQEFSADQIAWRTWNGGLWGWDEAYKFVLSSHTWDAESTVIKAAWELGWKTIGLCNNALNDFTSLAPESVGLTAEELASYIAEVRTLRAWCYYNLFEVWGGSLPLNTQVGSEIPGSASENFDEGCKIIYNFLSTELDESWAALPQNQVNRMNQAMNRMLKMRLLLNANVFIGEEKFTECGELAQSILDGDYGTYSLAPNYRDIYAYNNETCPEVVFAFASDVSHLNVDWIRTVPFFPSNTTLNDFFGCSDVASGWNCTILAPSYDNSANLLEGGSPTCFLDAPYNDRLGCVYERFQLGDVRRANYSCDANGMPTTGMFVQGAMRANYGQGDALLADADRDGQPLHYVDQLGTFLGLGRPLEDVMSPRWGETNSGVRLVKYPIYTDATGINFREADEVEFRLAEVVYTLAECKLRTGGSLEDAKNLVNSVKQRYFDAADWALAQGQWTSRGFEITEADKMDWMLSEWGIEFLNEGRRRRTDLRRFDQFTQGQWWFFGEATESGIDLPAKRDRKYEWFPLPASALNVNPGLVQNPNYL